MTPRKQPPSFPRPALFALLALTVAAGACRGSGGGGPAPEACANGNMELVVLNDRPLRVRVLEQSPLNATRVLGELPGRGTSTFDIQNFAGMIYSVQVVDTGELIAAETAHPRGFISRGATLTRQCN
jgi:hypothetical protein